MHKTVGLIPYAAINYFNGWVYQNLDFLRSVSYRAFSDKYILFYVNAPEKDYLLYYDIALQKETVIPF